MPRHIPTWLLLGLLAIGPTLEGLLSGAVGATQQTYTPTASASDRRLAPLLHTSLGWGLRSGPTRRVIDQVCLVPDEASFLAAISQWDQTTWFPVLIDDAELNLKFIRAFRPARVVRYGGPPLDLPRNSRDARWAAAVATVGRAWDDPDEPGPAPPGDDHPPFPQTPPGLVLSYPDSPSLVGAVALAAGRYQPLVHWPLPNLGPNPPEILPTDLALPLARQVEAIARRKAPDYLGLGDDCDFLTLAGNYPYKFEGGPQTMQGGPAAFDDLVGRDLRGKEGTIRPRWAYTGRLLGGPAASAYRAMCSLFLPNPSRATLFSYYGSAPPYTGYELAPAQKQLAEAGLHVESFSPPNTTLSAWHRAFDPQQPSGLVMAGTAGGPGDFRLHDGLGLTPDIPPGAPSAVHFIQSFSAANPLDPNSIAARWLDGGCFVYFGSVHEPYLSAFRTHAAVADLLIKGVPFAPAVRLTPEENPPMGSAWRLAVLGDPLYRITPGPQPDRVRDWPVSSRWPSYQASPRPASADAPQRLTWALRNALASASLGQPPDLDLVRDLLALRPADVPAKLRPLHQALLADSLLTLGRVQDLHEYLLAIPSTALSPASRRLLDWTRVLLLQHALDAGDYPAAASLTLEFVRTAFDAYSVSVRLQRIDPLLSNPDHKADWIPRLRQLALELGDDPRAASVKESLSKLSPTPKP